MKYKVGQKVRLTRVDVADQGAGLAAGQIHTIAHIDTSTIDLPVCIDTPVMGKWWLELNQISSVSLSAGEAMDWWIANPGKALLNKNGERCRLGYPMDFVDGHIAAAPYTIPDEGGE